MRTKKSILNTLTALIASFCSAILGIICQSLFLKILNVEYLGINGLFNNIIAMLSIAELGIGNAIVVNLYKPLYEDDHPRIKSLMQFYKKAYSLIALIVSIVGLILLPFLKYIVNDVTVDVNIYIIYLLFLFGTVMSYLLSYKRSILYADQKNYILNISQIIYLIVYNILQIVILYFTKNYYLYLTTKIVCQILENIVISLYVKRKYKYLNDKDFVKLDKKTEKNIFSKVKALFLHKIASFVVNGTDNIIISTFLGIKSVGLYSNYYTIIHNVDYLFTEILNSTTASVGNLLVENNQEKNYQVFKRIQFLNFWLTTFSSICLLTIIQSFITIWIGKEYLLNIYVVIVLILNYFLNSMRVCYNIFKDAAGIWQEDKYIPSIRAVSNIIFSILLVKFWGLSGVFLGTIISNLALWCYSYPKFIHKKLFHQSYLTYVKVNIKYLIYFILISICTYSISTLFHSSNIFLNVVTDTIVAITIPNIILIIISYKNKNFKYFVSIIKNNILKKG